METGEWERAKGITPSEVLGGIIWVVKGVSAARSGDMKAAQEAESKLAAMHDAQLKHSHHGGTDTGSEAFRLAVAAWIANASGNKEEGVKLMRQAADMQDRLGGSFAIFKPLREHLADILLMDGKNKEALDEYSAVLKVLPNRFNSLYGAGSAAFAAGNESEGREYYAKLLQMSRGDERTELVAARKRMTEQSASKQ